MEKIKKVLNLLTNQYFKSFKRFQKAYCFDVKKHTNEFNAGYLNLISAVLNGDKSEIRAALNSSWFFLYATRNEKDNLEFILLSII